MLMFDHFFGVITKQPNRVDFFNYFNELDGITESPCEIAGF